MAVYSEHAWIFSDQNAFEKGSFVSKYTEKCLLLEDFREKISVCVWLLHGKMLEFCKKNGYFLSKCADFWEYYVLLTTSRDKFQEFHVSEVWTSIYIM